MTTITIDVWTKHVVEIDTTVYSPNEQMTIEADVEDLKKVLKTDAILPKLDSDGKQLYILPQPDLEVISTITRQEKTTVEIDNTPVMSTVQVPLLDENGDQMEYEVTQPVYEQIPIIDEDAEIIGYQDGEIVGQEGTGQFLKLWTTQEQQEQDEDRNLLYWTNVEEVITTFEPQPDLEITEDDELWTEDLEKATYTIPSGTVISFEEYPTLFTLQDIQAYPTLEQVKEKVKEELQKRYEQELNSSFQSTYQGQTITLSYDKVSQDRFTKQAAILSNDSTITSIDWKTSLGFISMTPEEFVTVLRDGAAHESNLAFKLLYANASIDNSTTREQVYNITANW